MKPQRLFDAHEGDYSVDTELAGPQTIASDIESIVRMFDPLTTHSTGEQGGIAAENIRDGAIIDALVGDRTIDDTIADAYTNTGVVSKLLSFIAKAIKTLKGTTNWYDTPLDTINNIHARVNTNQTGVSTLTTALNTHKTSADHDIRYHSKTELLEGALDEVYYTQTALNNGQLDTRYYTKEYLDEWLADNDTVIHEEVFTIVNPNLGDGTFTYTIDGVTNIVGALLAGGEQVFTLVDGSYITGMNRIEAIVNDALRRSVASGGLIEVGETSFALASPEGAGAEITVKYYESITMPGEYNIRIDETMPPANNGKTVWYQIIG